MTEEPKGCGWIIQNAKGWWERCTLPIAGNSWIDGSALCRKHLDGEGKAIMKGGS